MKYFLLFLIILVFCIAPISAEKNKGLFSGDILQADLDAFTANTSDIPSYVDDGTPEETKLQDIAEWVNIGKTQLKSGNWAAAEEAFSKVTEQDSINNDGWEGYLLAIRGGGDFDKLLAVAEDATKKNPRYSSAWKYKGIALSGLDKSDEALSAFDKVLEMDPSNYQAWYYKGIAFDNLKQYNEAVTAYDQVLKINSEYAKAWNNKGVALNYLERYDEAIAAFNKAIEIDPGYQAANANKEIASEEKRKQSLGTIDIIDDSALIVPSSSVTSSPVPAMITLPPTAIPTPVFTVQPTYSPISTPSLVPSVVSATKSGSGMFRGNPARTGEFSGQPALNGQLKWKINTGEQKIDFPTISNDRVFLSIDEKGDVSIDAKSGSIIKEFYNIWIDSFGNEHKSISTTWSGNPAISPAVVDGIIYSSSIDYFQVFDSETGKDIWSFHSDHFEGDFRDRNQIYLSPAVVDGLVYFANEGGIVYALDTTSGEKIWEYDSGLLVEDDEQIVSLAIDDGILIIGRQLAIIALDAKSGKEIWKLGELAERRFFQYPERNTGVAITDGLVYISNQHHLFALNLHSGEKKWEFKLSNIHTLPAVHGGLVFIGNYHGELFALNAKSGKIVWKFEKTNYILSSPAIADWVLYIGAANFLFALDTETGDVLWEFETKSDVQSPSVYDGVVYFGSYDYNGRNPSYFYAVE